MTRKNNTIIPHDEYAHRRDELRQRLGNEVAILFAGEHDLDSHEPFHPHPHFTYFTGVTNEPGAILLIDPTNPVEDRREMLFLRPINPEAEKWTGYRPEIGQPLRRETGFKNVYRLNQFGRFLNAAVKRSKHLACLHPLAQYNRPVSPDLVVFNKVAERIPGVQIEDHTNIPVELRATKSDNEIAMIENAIDITRQGLEAAIQSIKPGMNEFDVQEMIEHTYRTNGSRGPAFPTVAGSGFNTTVLHYRDNNKQIEDGDLILIDTGATFGEYGADITRTVPANGRFTDRQREIYNIVLRAEEATIDACTPGVRLAELDRIARSIIKEAGYGDAFIHSIGHHLGVETHDPAPDAPLAAGNVITIEPGIYLPGENIGVRIEDDVLITAAGCRNLSESIPKQPDEIEKSMNV